MNIPAGSETAPVSPLRLDSPFDTLEIVRKGLRYLPDNSLVIIGLHHGFTGAYLRLDYDPRRSDATRISEYVAEVLMGRHANPKPDAVIAVCFTSELGYCSVPPGVVEEEETGIDGESAVTSGSRIHVKHFIQELRQTLKAHHVRVLPGWIVSEGFMRDPECGDEQCCPAKGTDIRAVWNPQSVWNLSEQPAPVSSHSDEATDPFTKAASFLARMGLSICPPEQKSPRSPGAPCTASSIRAGDPLSSPPGAGSVLPFEEAGHSMNFPREPVTNIASLLEILALWETTIDDASHSVGKFSCDAATVTTLSSSLDLSGLGEPLTVLAADSFASAAHGLLAVGESTTAHHLRQHYSHTLAASTDSPPEWDRIQGLESILLQMEPTSRSGLETLVAIVAWIEWAKGQGSMSSYLMEALEPHDHQLGTYPAAVKQLTTCSGPAPWAKNRDFSYSTWKLKQKTSH